MIRGLKPAMLLDAQGRLIAISTGVDFVSEHAHGCAEMTLELTGTMVLPVRAVGALLKSGEMVTPVNLQASYTISRDLEAVGYAETIIDGEPEAVLAYSMTGSCQLPHGFTSREVSPNLSFFRDSAGMAGAWNERSFGFRVRGETKVTQLRDFAFALKASQVMFAGSFIQDPLNPMNGVILARTDLLTPRHQAQLALTQARYEEDCRLHALARTDELRLAAKDKDLGIVHLWPTWKSGLVDGEVVYAMNPGRGAVPPFGPYQYEHLMEWIASGAKTPLPQAS